MGFRSIAGDLPPSPIQIDAWVYIVVAIVLFILTIVAMAMLASVVARIWDHLRRRPQRDRRD